MGRPATSPTSRRRSRRRRESPRPRPPPRRTITVTEDLDLALGAAAARGDRGSVVEAGATRVELDLSGCEFLDSTGLSLLVTTHRRLAADGGALRLRGVHGQVASVLDMSGVTDLLIDAVRAATPPRSGRQGGMTNLASLWSDGPWSPVEVCAELPGPARGGLRGAGRPETYPAGRRRAAHPAVRPGFPAPGTEFEHASGRREVVDDRTEALRRPAPPLDLEVHAGPFHGVVDFEVARGRPARAGSASARRPRARSPCSPRCCARSSTPGTAARCGSWPTTWSRTAPPSARPPPSTIVIRHATSCGGVRR